MRKLFLLLFVASNALAYGDLEREVEYDLIRSWNNWSAIDACNMATSSVANLITEALAGKPFVFRDMTEIPGFNKYNVVAIVPKDAMYLTMWKRMTPESREFFTTMMQPHYEFAKKMIEKLGEDAARSYDFDSYINSTKYECLIMKQEQIRNRRPESNT